MTTAFYKEDSIDLGELMHEQFVLALPMKPLCARDVQGALRALRHEFQQGDLRVRAAWTDPRLAVLEGLESKTDKKET